MKNQERIWIEMNTENIDQYVSTLTGMKLFIIEDDKRKNSVLIKVERSVPDKKTGEIKIEEREKEVKRSILPSVLRSYELA